MARFCRTAALILLYCDAILAKEIICFVQDLLGSKSQFVIPEKLRNQLLERLNRRQSPLNEPFYWARSQKLRDLMVKLLVCSTTMKNVCMVGTTGLGKTNIAKAFAEISSISEDRGRKAYRHIMFNPVAKLDDIDGQFQIESGSPKPAKGPLFRSMEKSLVFIVDEFILDENSTIQGLAV
jgi:MoxR-like ATPase